MIADTSGLLALDNAAEPAHERVDAAVESLDEPLVVSPFVVAELDSLIAKRVRRYSDQDVGATDASLVVLADRFSTRRILTLDHRHFGVVRSLDGRRLVLAP